MSDREKEMDRLYDMINEGYVPKPVKILIILFSMLFGPILALVDEISKRSSRKRVNKEFKKN